MILNENNRVTGFFVISFLVTIILLPLSLYINRDKLVMTSDDYVKSMLSNVTYESIFIEKFSETLDQNNHVIKRRSPSTPSKLYKKQCGQQKTCGECVGFETYQCLWCTKNEKCLPYPFRKFLPQASDCEWTHARWGVCWMDFRALVIAVSVIGGILFLIICCCLVRCCRCVKDCVDVVCCCCKCNCKERSERKKELLQLQRLERKLESQAKRQELMLKYGRQRPPGVAFGNTGNYTTFENET
ncbi:uncharacterized protein LOC143471599 isoform X2 [Clavelina lepadiformis]